MTPTASPTGASFRRKNGIRVAAGVASVGLFAGLSLVGAASASAASAADCTTGPTGNTATANALGDNQSDIQDLLDASAPIICIVGTFNLTAPLTFAYSGATIFGETDAVLDGNDLVSVLIDATYTRDITVQNLTVQNGFSNDANFSGGISAHAVVAIDSAFLHNSAGNLGFGGAISTGGTLSGSVDITGSSFVGNTAGAIGGAVFSYGVVSATDTTFEDNTSQFGGAIAGYGATTDITGSTFTHNTATLAGGAIASYGLATGASTLTVTDSTFDSNEAQFAGAIFGYTLDVENSTFVGNQAGVDPEQEGPIAGGAIAAIDGLILQSTFLDNSSSEESGGQSIANFTISSDDATMNVRGNIFVSSTTGPQLASDTDVESISTFTDLGGNVFSTAAADETSLVSVQPSTQFGLTASALFATSALADNGGTTETVALSATSPAIDAVPVGSPSVTLDQRGVSRTPLSDAGSYEEGAAPAKLAATGLVPNGTLGGIAVLVLGLGAGVVAVTRRYTASR